MFIFVKMNKELEWINEIEPCPTHIKVNGKPYIIPKHLTHSTTDVDLGGFVNGWKDYYRVVGVVTHYDRKYYHVILGVNTEICVPIEYCNEQSDFRFKKC
jgi:hypothetical protein